MARFEGGIFSRASNSIGGVTFGAARTRSGMKQTARERVTPSDPLTVNQASRRAKMAFINRSLSALLRGSTVNAGGLPASEILQECNFLQNRLKAYHYLLSLYASTIRISEDARDYEFPPQRIQFSDDRPILIEARRAWSASPDIVSVRVSVTRGQVPAGALIFIAGLPAVSHATANSDTLYTAGAGLYSPTGNTEISPMPSREAGNIRTASLMFLGNIQNGRINRLSNIVYGANFQNPEDL